MPNYDYKCQKCESEFELFLSLEEREKDSNKKICPQCGAKEVRQLLSQGAAVLKRGLSKSRDTGSCPGGGGCGGSCPFGG